MYPSFFDGTYRVVQQGILYNKKGGFSSSNVVHLMNEIGSITARVVLVTDGQHPS